MRRAAWLLLLPVLAALWWWRGGPVDRLPAIDPEQRAGLPAAVGAWLKQRPAPDPLPAFDLVYAALWREGRLLSEAWGAGDRGGSALEAAVRGAAAGLGEGADPDRVELSLTHSRRGFGRGDLQSLPGEVHRGVLGLELRWQEHTLRYAPSQMIARNLSFERALQEAAGRARTGPSEFLAQAELRPFDARQVLVDLRAGRATELFRGNRTVLQSQVDENLVSRSAAAMAQWMRRNLQPDGRMVYRLYPSSGREGSGNNMIRQWMASLCLSRMAARAADPELEGLAARNLRYNLRRFYTEEHGLGLIEYRGTVKLGAVALAALALLEHPQSERFRDEIEALVATTDALWREDGSFQTFYRPASRSAEPNLHNFYPGETLLLWASLLQRQADPERERRFMQSFRYYREWHRDNRRPSFIPWHTQAYYLEWLRTGEDELRQWIFEMNDWLLGMQTRSRVAYDDTAGRFYDPRPEFRHFGPPHASSTGVYLEGLIDAWQLARDSGETERAERYRSAIVRALRSVAQLQFRGGADTWFVRDPERVIGGLRTTVYNNVIRVDNVQHNLMALMKILDRFDASHYRLPGAG